MIELNKFYNLDCMEGMKDIPDKYFDLAIVDPPYGIGFDGQKYNQKTNRKSHEFKGWDKAIPNREYFDELFRISKNQIVFGGNYMTEYLAPSKCWVSWDKMQEFSGSEFELAWTSFKSPCKTFRMSRVEAYTGIIKFHPTQKPIKLYEWLLNNYAKQGDKILDTHVGSASSLIACYNLGFEYVGFELDKDYYDMACKRIEARKAQMDMFHMDGEE